MDLVVRVDLTEEYASFVLTSGPLLKCLGYYCCEAGVGSRVGCVVGMLGQCRAGAWRIVVPMMSQRKCEWCEDMIGRRRGFGVR